MASKAKIEFAYNDRGQRVSKQSYVSNTHKTLTYYVRDLSGNVMAVYEGSQTLDPSTGAVINNKPANVTEYSIFGSSRIGIFKPSYSNFGYLYELTDHLGNVRAVITSGVRGQLVSLTIKTDYYPFGMPLPNQQITDQNYRYAFQGQEKDPETGMEAFELRLWL